MSQMNRWKSLKPIQRNNLTISSNPCTEFSLYIDRNTVRFLLLKTLFIIIQNMVQSMKRYKVDKGDIIIALRCPGPCSIVF